jgi:hypothetical protein
MTETPSTRRRKGYDDFCFGGNPNELNPYKHNPYCAIDWRQGWDKAESAYNERRAEAEELEHKRQLPISVAIDLAQTDDDVKEILRRITEHLGME